MFGFLLARLGLQLPHPQVGNTAIRCARLAHSRVDRLLRVNPRVEKSLCAPLFAGEGYLLLLAALHGQ